MTRANYGSGSVKQTGPGRFQLRWSEGTDPFTGKHVRRAETITAKNLTAARRELASRSAVGRRGSRVTLGELLDRTLNEIPVTEDTRDVYRFALAHVPATARKWEAASIAVTDARMVIEGLTIRLSARQVRKTHGAIMSCWRQATLNGWVTENPWRGQRMPPIVASAGVALTDEEVGKLLAVVESGLEECWIRIHLATGARPGEIVGLRWSHIDLEESLVTFTDAKHADRPRTVSLDDVTVDCIRSWQVSQRERALAAGCPLAADPWLISAVEDSSEPWRRSYAGGFRWRKVRDAAKIRGSLRLYDLRHTHNSWLEADGFDATTRAARIGNSPATNQRVYSHPMRDREAASAVAKRLG